MRKLLDVRSRGRVVTGRVGVRPWPLPFNEAGPPTCIFFLLVLFQMPLLPGMSFREVIRAMFLGVIVN